MLLALDDAATIAGIVVAGIGTAIGSAVVLYLNTRSKPSIPSPPPLTDAEVQAIKTREPALLSLIVELREEVVECTRKAEAAAEDARRARDEAERHSAEAKRWQDEVLRLQHLVEGLIERGRSSQIQA